METLSRLTLTFVLNAVWQVTLVMAVAAVGARLLRRAPARYLNALWIAALALSALLPFATWRDSWNPANRLPTPIPGMQQVTTPGPAPRAFRTITEGGSPGPLARALTATPAEPDLARHSRWLPSLFRHRRHPLSLPPLLAYAALGFYLLTLLCHLTRLLRAWRLTVKLRRTAHLRGLPDGMASLVARCRTALGLENVTILCSSQASGPAAMGFRRPVIVLPETLFEASSPEDLTAALCHEMAHIRRHDYLLNLICEFIFLPVAFHPAAWLMKRRIDETRELACDEAAAGQLAGARAYARSLLSLARAMSALPSLSSPRYTLGVFDANILEERIMRLLAKGSHVSKRAARLSLAGAALLLGAGCLLASAFSLSITGGARAAGRSPGQPSAAHPDFSGRWVMDKTRSDIDGMFPRSYTQVIGEQDSQIKVVNDWEEWESLKGVLPVAAWSFHVPELLLRPDGVERSGSSGDFKFQSKTQWEDARLVTSLSWPVSLTNALTKEMRKSKIETRWVRYFSEGGAMQILEVTNRFPEGPGAPSYDAKLVFVRAAALSGSPGSGVAGGVPGDASRAFLGTWRGEFQGMTFIVLTLQKEGDSLRGTVNVGAFSIDHSGQVTRVKAEPSAQDAVPIFDVKRDGSLLSFRCKSIHWAREAQFLMRLTGDDGAELKSVVESPRPGERIPEWWKLSRQPDDSNAEVPQGGIVGGVKGGIAGGPVGGVVGGVKGSVIGGVISGVPAAEEKPTAVLSGNVSDPSGAMVPNAIVTLYCDSGPKRTAVTNDAGEFSFTGLPQGSCEMKVFHDGFEDSRQSVSIPRGDSAKLRIGFLLTPSSATQSMVVTAKAPPAVLEKRHAAAPKRIRVGGQVEASKLVTSKKPEYPEGARARGVEGMVLLEAVISMEGVPLSLRVLESPDPGLSDAALAAVRQWRYQPTLLNGQPIEVVTTIAITFRLEG